MPPLNLTSITLPDLTDTDKYPDVAHAPSCTDSWTPSKVCLGTDLHRVRPYGLPTEPLAQLKYPWARRHLFQIPAVPLVPPSLGTLCPTIHMHDADLHTGDLGDFRLEVQKAGGDACRPTIIPSITFPCTKLDAGAKTINMVPGGTEAEWDQTFEDNDTNDSCLKVILDTLTIPCTAVTAGTVSTTLDGLTGSLTFDITQDGCNATIGANLSLSVTGGGGGGGGGAGVSAGFYVGTVADHDPDESSSCVVCYPPGTALPVYDKHGLMGSPNTQLGVGVNTYTNRSNSILMTGDPISIAETSGDATQWAVFT